MNHSVGGGGSLAGSQFLKVGCWKRGGELFQGGVAGFTYKIN